MDFIRAYHKNPRHPRSIFLFALFSIIEPKENTGIVTINS